MSPPSSLFSLCLDFVASNIQLVESFIGFPETVGNKIFEEAITKRQFKNIKDNDTGKSNLKIFFDAYAKNGILKSLCLQRCHLFVNDALVDCPWLLQELTCLDLSFCGLGDNHELLPQIVTLPSLEVLNLKANHLSDDGIRQLTTPLRFYGKSHCLNYIDLSSNHITARSLRFLKSFKSLCAMIVTDTSISKQAGSCEMGSNLSRHNNTCLCCANLCRVTTSGWAKDVLNSWKQEYHEKHPSPQSPSVTSSSSFTGKSVAINASTFYSKRKPSTIAPRLHTNDKETAQVEFILVTEHFHCPMNSREKPSQAAQSQHYSEQTFNRLAAHSSTKSIISTPKKGEILSQPQRHFTVTFSESSPLTVSHDRKYQPKRKMVNKTFDDNKKMKLNGSDLTVTGNKTFAANACENQRTKKTRGLFPISDFDDVLKFYHKSETSAIDILDDRQKQSEKRKSALEILEDWT